MYNETHAKISWFLIFLGFNVTFFPQFILGSQGMPRRYFDYLPEFTALNQMSTVGSWILAVGFFYCAGYLWKALRSGPKASGNPWGALTLEWQSPSPPPLENFLETPVVKEGFYEYKAQRA
jgi:cytochrome c oxidase subunit 1